MLVFTQDARRIIAHRVRHQHPERGKSPGIFRDNDGPHAQLLRNLARVQTSAASERDQREVARIVAALDRNDANRPLHIRVRDAQNPGSRGSRIDF